MRDNALAVVIAGLGLAAGLGILLGIEPAWLTRWLFPAGEEVCCPHPESEAPGESLTLVTP